MIQKRYAGIEFLLACAIEINGNANLGFVGVAGDCSGTLGLHKIQSWLAKANNSTVKVVDIAVDVAIGYDTGIET